MYLKIVKWTTERLLRLFLPEMASIEVLYGKIRFEVQETLPTTVLNNGNVSFSAARVFVEDSVIVLQIAKIYFKPVDGKYIVRVSGLKTRTLLRAFVVNIAHEIIHILQHVYALADKQHGDDFIAIGRSLYGFTNYLFDEEKIETIEDDNDGIDSRRNAIKFIADHKMTDLKTVRWLKNHPELTSMKEFTKITDVRGFTLLMMASDAGKLETVKYLLTKGVKFVEKYGLRWNALRIAQKAGHTHVVEFLVEESQEQDDEDR